MDDCVVEVAAAWAAHEFKRYTAMADAGRLGVNRILPEARVTWSDVGSQFPGLANHGLDPATRCAFQSAFEAEMTRLGLLGILRHHKR